MKDWLHDGFCSCNICRRIFKRHTAESARCRLARRTESKIARAQKQQALDCWYVVQLVLVGPMITSCNQTSVCCTWSRKRKNRKTPC